MSPRRLPFLAACLVALASAAPGAARAVPGRNLELKAHFNNYPPGGGAPLGAGYASCWSYIHGDGREYAVIGTANGTAIYNVTDPANSYFVGFIGGITSLWREMKSYRNWIYVVTEGYTCPPGPGQGVQIIRMTDPEHPVLAATYAGTFNRSHTVSVDTARAILICNGTNLTTPGSPNCGQTQMGMRILSLANPEAPVEIGSWPGGSGVPSSQYVHDSVPVGNRLYAASIYSHIERLLDFTNPAAPFELSAWTYSNAFYTHNSWPDATGNYVFVTDEQNGQTVRVFDISNPLAPVVVYEWTANPQAIAHNVHVLGDELYVAHYTEGVHVFDISDPAHPAEFAWADTYPGTSGSYYGVWGVCPYFPSGTVIASDMQTGLYVFRPVRDYGILRARVVDASTSQPLAGVRVRLTTQGDSLATPADGLVAFAPNPGTHTVEVRRFGSEVASATRLVSPGGVDSVTLALTSKPTADLSGVVRDAGTQAGLSSAELILAYTPVHQFTDPSGNYALTGVPDDLYRVEARRAGYVPLVFERRIGPGFDGQQDFVLEPAATWDALEVASGWAVGVTSDSATSGAWTRVVPFGTTGGSVPARTTGSRLRSVRETPGGHACGASPGLAAAPGGGGGGACGGHGGVMLATSLAGNEPEFHCGCGSACMCAKSATALGQVQPGSDHTPDAGTRCFITGQATTNDPENGDVDGGRTTLTSPALDLASMADPVIGFWRWFYTNGDASDWLALLVSNDDGFSWVSVDTTRGLHNEWQEQAFHVAAHVPPTAQVRIRLVAADLGPASIVEAGVDDVVAYDAATALVSVPASDASARLAFRAPQPNPARGTVTLALHLPRGGPVMVEVLDLAGRRVRTLHRGGAEAGILDLRWDGRDDSGRGMGAGLYHARAVAGAEESQARFVIVR